MKATEGEEAVLHTENSFSSHEVVPSKFKKYAFGVQGKTLRRHVSLAGAFGFLLFGYDQGVLGVRFDDDRREDCC